MWFFSLLSVWEIRHVVGHVGSSECLLQFALTLSWPVGSWSSPAAHSGSRARAGGWRRRSPETQLCSPQPSGAAGGQNTSLITHWFTLPWSQNSVELQGAFSWQTFVFLRFEAGCGLAVSSCLQYFVHNFNEIEPWLHRHAPWNLSDLFGLLSGVFFFFGTSLIRIKVLKQYGLALVRTEDLNLYFGKVL